MEPDEFRKLRVHLPRQPLVNQRPWWIAGLLLALVILLVVAWSYYTHKKPLLLPEKQVKKALKYSIIQEQLVET
jgi:hypothetical protein